MKTRKNLWGTLVIAAIWGAFGVGVEIVFSIFRGDYFMILMGSGFGVLIALFLTYKMLDMLQYIPDRLEKQQSGTRRRNAASLLKQLDDDDLEDLLEKLDDDDLRDLKLRLSRLQDTQPETLEDLLAVNREKRKNY